MNERGFLSGPLLWIGIALVLWAVTATHFALAYAKKVGEVQAAYDGFVANVKTAGEKAQREKDEQDAKNAKLHNDTVEDLRRTLASRNATITRLRNTLPSPDGGTVSVTRCDSGGVSSPAGEFVPVADYRALQDRAYDDAVMREAMRKTFEGLVKNGVLRVEGSVQ
jgi:hypothetical protein